MRNTRGKNAEMLEFFFFIKSGSVLCWNQVAIFSKERDLVKQLTHGKILTVQCDPSEFDVFWDDGRYTWAYAEVLLMQSKVKALGYKKTGTKRAEDYL